MLNNKMIGKNIHKLRKRSDLTQVELSNFLGVSHQAISKWENGECLPDIEIVLKLVKLFNRSVEELLLTEQSLNEVDINDQLDNSIVKTLDKMNIQTGLSWENVLEEIRKQISKPSFDTWFKHTTAKYEGETYIIYCPNNFSTEWLYSRYSSLIIETLEKITRDAMFKIEFRTLDNINKNFHALQKRATLNLEATD